MMVCIMNAGEKPQCRPFMVLDHEHKVTTSEECHQVAEELLQAMKAVDPKVMGELQGARCSAVVHGKSDDDMDTI